MEFAYDGGGLGKGGTVTLFVDGEQVGEGRVGGDRADALLGRRDLRRRLRHRLARQRRLHRPRAAGSPGTVNWVQLDIGEAAEDLDHLISPEERLQDRDDETVSDGCCTPSREPSAPEPRPAAAATSSPVPVAFAVADIPAGEARLGSEQPVAYPEDGEGPVRRVRLGAFRIGAHAGHQRRVRRVRRRHRPRHRGRALRLVVRLRRPAARRLPADPRRRARAVVAPGRGRRLAPPGGPAVRSSTAARDHPVVHVSLDDAAAYCALGRRHGCRPRPSGSTPPAAASRAGVFPWGDELEPGGEHRMNVWQGEFPAQQHARRRLRTAPRRSTRSRRTATASTT